MAFQFLNDLPNAGKYRVTDLWNETEIKGLPVYKLDQKLLDHDVARIMRTIFRPPPKTDFALMYPGLAHGCFSKPYSEVARDEFGYRE